MKKTLQKLNRDSGFTLSEVLIAVVILVMITAGIMPAAMRAYRNAVDAANAQVLLSTTVRALRNELSTAWDVKSVDDTTITYMSADTGSKTRMFIKDGRIMLQEYDDFTADHVYYDNSSVSKPEERPLVSDAMRQTTDRSSVGMDVTYTEIEKTNGCVSITGLAVMRNGNTLAKFPEGTLLMIRPLGGENG